MKLTEVRMAVLNRLVADGGYASFYLSRRLKIPQTSCRSALQWLRQNGLVTYSGFWQDTDLGRTSLTEQLPENKKPRHF